MGGTLLEGRYRIEDVIAEGGMGIVYRGFQKSINRPVAVKFLNPDICSSRETYHRFFQEARLAASIEHPGIVDVYDMGTTQGGIPYIVMELLSGEDLAARIAESGPLDLLEALEMCEHILEALAAVHHAGVVHRDLKPENIFLADRSGGSTEVKILDFGVSRLVSEESGKGRITEAGRVYGTPHYVSPEQARGKLNVDHRSDLYSATVLLFEMLIGVPPFQADSPVGLILDIVSAPPPNPLELRPDMPPAVAGIIIRGLEKNPADRFQSASEMIGALKLARKVRRYRVPRSRTRTRASDSTGSYRIIGPPPEEISAKVPLRHLLDAQLVPGPSGISRASAGPAARRERLRTVPVSRDRMPTPSRRADVTPNPDMGDPDE